MATEVKARRGLWEPLGPSLYPRGLKSSQDPGDCELVQGHRSQDSIPSFSTSSQTEVRRRPPFVHKSGDSIPSITPFNRPREPHSRGGGGVAAQPRARASRRLSFGCMAEPRMMCLCLMKGSVRGGDVEPLLGGLLPGTTRSGLCSRLSFVGRKNWGKK